MRAKRELTMRQLRQMLRLHHEGVSAREIGRRLGAARSTIQDNLKRAKEAGLSWPLAADLTDDVLEQRLFSKAGYIPSVRRLPEPDWGALAREMKRPGVNLTVLWEEYREAPAAGIAPHGIVTAVVAKGLELFKKPDQRQTFARRLAGIPRQHRIELGFPAPQLRTWLDVTLIRKRGLFRPQHLADRVA